MLVVFRRMAGTWGRSGAGQENARYRNEIERTRLMLRRCQRGLRLASSVPDYKCAMQGRDLMVKIGICSLFLLQQFRLNGPYRNLRAFSDCGK
jgi:hypothetical protein